MNTWGWSCYQYSPSPSPHLLVSLLCQHQQPLPGSTLPPAKWKYANALVCNFHSIPPWASAVAKPLLPYNPLLSHLCALSSSAPAPPPPPTLLCVDHGVASQAALSWGGEPTSGGWLRSKCPSGNAPIPTQTCTHTTAATQQQGSAD